MRRLLETLFLRNYARYVTWRWPQVGGVFNNAGVTETTIYVAGLVEKVTKGATTEYRHLITPNDADPMNVAAETSLKTAIDRSFVTVARFDSLNTDSSDIA